MSEINIKLHLVAQEKFDKSELISTNEQNQTFFKEGFVSGYNYRSEELKPIMDIVEKLQNINVLSIEVLSLVKDLQKLK